MTFCRAGELVAAGLGCGTGEGSVGGEGDMGDRASDTGGDSTVVGEGAAGADRGDESAIGLDCKLSCGVPVFEGYDSGLLGRLGEVI